jgi:hypothetical protein
MMRFDVLDVDEVDERWSAASSTDIMAAAPAPAPRRYRFMPPPIRTRKVSAELITAVEALLY